MKHPKIRVSPAVAELLKDRVNRTEFEKESALQHFVVGIERALEEEGLDARKLADRCEKHVQSVQRALKGKQNLTVGMMIELAVALGRTVNIRVEPLRELEAATRSSKAELQMHLDWKASLATRNAELTLIADPGGCHHEVKLRSSWVSGSQNEIISDELVGAGWQ